MASFFCRLQIAVSDETGDEVRNQLETAPEARNNLAQRFSAGTSKRGTSPNHSMSLKAKLEAIIYAAETPITLDHIFQLVKESVINDGATDEAEAKSVVRATLDDLVADYNAADHGVEIRQVAGGYRMSTKPEHHDVVRMFAKSLKPPIRLSLPALETLAVIAYKQPVTVPEILEIRGVQSPSAIKTLLDKRLIVAKGRKETVGRPMMYGTSKEFLIQFGLKDLTELPSIEDFQDLAGGGE